MEEHKHMNVASIRGSLPVPS